jgi:hypothetical protein
MRWDEVGFTVPPKRPLSQEASWLDHSTDALLEAIESTTGERPVFDGDSFDLHPVTEFPVSQPGHGWVTERRVLAMDVLRWSATLRRDRESLRRASAALRWDVALDADWTEVDARLVGDALRKADAILGPPPGQLDVRTGSFADGLTWPIHPVQITSAFGARHDPFGEGIRRHAGLDLFGVVGQPVRCAASGVVLYAGNRGAYGLHVEVKHPNGLLTRYAHLSNITVKRGERILGGEMVGLVGQSGRATGPHLHFEIWRDGLPVDPQVALPEPDVTERGDLPLATR